MPGKQRISKYKREDMRAHIHFYLKTCIVIVNFKEKLDLHENQMLLKY
jgi:hypothetical protein